MSQLVMADREVAGRVRKEIEAAKPLSKPLGVEVPVAVYEAVTKFLLDHKSGNVTLMVDKGRVLKGKVEEFVS